MYQTLSVTRIELATPMVRFNEQAEVLSTTKTVNGITDRLLFLYDERLITAK